MLTEADVAGRYTFAHALIEHTLYDDLSAGRRARTHRAVAEALEEICGDDPGERIGELAYHWAHATQPPDAGKAIAYAQRAGDRALAQLAPDEALRWYRDALDLLGPASADDPRRRAELLLGLGDAQRQTGDPAHRETLLAAGRLADDIDAIDVLVGAALAEQPRVEQHHRRGRPRPRRDAQSARSHGSATRTAPTAPACSHCCASRAPGTPTSTNACRWRTQAVDIARRTGDDAALVDAIRLCHESITMPQTLELRRRWDAEACDLADDLGDPIARLHVNDYRSLDALEAGDLATMRDGVRHLRVGVRADRAAAQPVADRLPPGVAADARGRPRRRRAVRRPKR